MRKSERKGGREHIDMGRLYETGIQRSALSLYWFAEGRRERKREAESKREAETEGLCVPGAPTLFYV